MTGLVDHSDWLYTGFIYLDLWFIPFQSISDNFSYLREFAKPLCAHPRNSVMSVWVYSNYWFKLAGLLIYMAGDFLMGIKY